MMRQLVIKPRDPRWKIPTGVSPLRRVTKIIVHYSATRVSRRVTVEKIRNEHLDRGCRDIGYHWVVDRDGVVWEGRPESLQGAHCGREYNRESIGVCWLGGLDGNGSPVGNITKAQKRSMGELLRQLHRRYPDALLYGHNDLMDTQCPMVDVREMWGHIFQVKS